MLQSRVEIHCRKLAGKCISIKGTPFSHSLLLAGTGYVPTGKRIGGADPWTCWLWQHAPTAVCVPGEFCGSFVVAQNLLLPLLDHGNVFHYEAVVILSNRLCL